MPRGSHVFLAAAALALWLPAAAFAQARYDPRFTFLTISVSRFDIYYHQGERDLALRLAAMVEEVAAEVDKQFGAPRGRVRIILVDQTDQSNGWAAVVPYNLIELAAVPPPSSSMIGNTDDWLKLVFAHEYTHVVHLEKSRGWLGSLRHVFGRVPLFYSNLFLPGWQIEGLATFEESEVTGGGRVPAGDFRMILDQAAAAGKFAPLDRAASGIVDWPGGNTPYLYGSYFHHYLAEKYGRDSMTRLAEDTARRLPLLGSRAYRQVFGRSLGTLWKEFEADTKQRARAPEEDDRGTRLTRHGFGLTAPAFTADGRIFYSIANPHGFPALMELPLDGSPPRQVTTRYGGSRLSSAGDLLVFDQLEIARNTTTFSDLYAVPVRGGGARRLTREARAADPDVSPDGTTIVCTVQDTGRRALATMTIPAVGDLGEPQELVSEDATEFSTPRWSPDGRSIVAERRQLFGPSEIVIVDVGTRAVRTLVTSPRGRNISPLWLPGGAAILFASDRDGGPFMLYAADVSTGAVRRLAGAGVGAQFPALSPDGTRLVFVGYSADGYDLYSIDFAAAAWVAVPAGDPETTAPVFALAPATVVDGVHLPHSAPYRPWPTLAPRWWSPIVETDGDGHVRIGAESNGFDALGRHNYSVAGAWSTRNTPYAFASYVYARWRPALYVSATIDTDPWRTGEVRSRDLDGGVLLPVRKVRWSSAGLAALHLSTETFDCVSCEPAVDVTRARRALRLGWTVSNAKVFGYSISREQGAYAGVTTELTRRALGSDGDATSFTADVRGYLPVYPRHGVLAVRAAAASSSGDPEARRVFSASGTTPPPAGFGFGSDAIGLLRGYEEGAVVGSHAAVMNLDYRFPLLNVQRGWGTLPVFLRQVHGAVFADLGHAWDDTFTRADLRRSYGGEIAFDTVLLNGFPATFAAGAARRDDPGGRHRGWVAFGRIGRAF